jgi:hypothetical protein
MNDITTLTIAGMACMTVISIVSYRVITAQQRTIGELTNKLMARDYKEYISMTTPPQPEKPKRERQSWYDEEMEIEDVQ